MNRHGTSIGLIFALASVGCGGAQLPPDPAGAPVAVMEPEPLRIAGTTIGPSGRATPFGVSGADPYATLEGSTLDPTYAYTPQNPVRVGGFSSDDPEAAQRAFLNALWGPQGQPIYYERIGSCCPLPDMGMLDAFALTYEGLEGPPLVVYVDLYHSDRVWLPLGLRGAPQR